MFQTSDINYELAHGGELHACQLPNELLVLIESFFLGDDLVWEVTISALCYVGKPVYIIVTLAVCWTHRLSLIHNHLNKSSKGEVPEFFYDFIHFEFIVIGRY